MEKLWSLGARPTKARAMGGHQTGHLETHRPLLGPEPRQCLVRLFPTLERRGGGTSLIVGVLHRLEPQPVPGVCACSAREAACSPQLPESKDRTYACRHPPAHRFRTRSRPLPRERLQVPLQHPQPADRRARAGRPRSVPKGGHPSLRSDPTLTPTRSRCRGRDGLISTWPASSGDTDRDRNGAPLRGQ